MKSIFHTKTSFKNELLGVIPVDPLKVILTAKLQKVSVCPGNVTLVAEKIWLEEALDRKEIDFQKKCNTGWIICKIFKCILHPQT